MENYIQFRLKLHDYKYIEIENQEIRKHIHNLFTKGINDRDNLKIDDSIIDLYYGIHYEIKKDYDQMKNTIL